MMDKRWKYALAALLGFSTACSTARRTAADRETADSTASSRAAADTTTRVQINRIRLMYGVPSPPPEVVRPTETAAPSGAETER